MTLVQLIRKRIGDGSPQLLSHEHAAWIDRELERLPRAELLRLISEAMSDAPKPRMTVKPLIWQGSAGHLFSNSLAGRYVIHRQQYGVFALLGPKRDLGRFPNAEEAMVVAQRDYLSRSLPVLHFLELDVSGAVLPVEGVHPSGAADVLGSVALMLDDADRNAPAAARIGPGWITPVTLAVSTFGNVEELLVKEGYTEGNAVLYDVVNVRKMLKAMLDAARRNETFIRPDDLDVHEDADRMRQTLEIIATNHEGTPAGDAARDVLVSLGIWNSDAPVPDTEDAEPDAGAPPLTR